MKSTFSIPGVLPGYNEMGDAARTHWSQAHKQKKRFTRICGQYIIACQVPFFKLPVQVHFKWIERDQRRDFDNVCAGAKLILDALVKTGRLPNDSRKWVTFISNEMAIPDKKNPRVQVTIQTVEI